MGNLSGDEVSKVLREIAESCRREQWSTAIRLLSSLSGLSSSPTLLCNRALCYSKLELHKHVLKDCDKALVLNPCTLQAYLYKGQSLVAMGKKEDGLVAWQQGYEAGLGQPSDLQMLLQLHCLATQSKFGAPENSSPPSTPPQVEKLGKEALPNNSTGNIGRVVKNDGKNRTRQLKQGPSILGVDVRMARGVAQVNVGNYEEAVQVFTQLIKENPKSTGALVGRGTAYAFQRQLEAAIDDFTKAIELQPDVAEAWKRRGQARAAVAPSLEAVADLSKALELDPNAPETLYDRGVVYYKLKDFQLAIDDLRAYLALDCTNRYAYNYYGLALTSTGDYVEGMAAHYKALELDPSLRESWTHLAKLYKELGDSENSFHCLEKVLKMDPEYVHAYRLKGLLLFSLGDHRGAAKELTTVLELEPRNSDCLYLRGSCLHAIGNYGEAVNDYDNVLDADVKSGESRILQFLAFYQREIALYTVSKRGKPFNHFDIDGDLDPLFKEAWCKRLSPMVLFPAYNPQSLPGHLLSNGCCLQPEDLALTKSRKILIDEADRLGHLIQYNCPGFLKNVRQHRMAGLAVLDIAQKVATTLRSSRAAKNVQEPSTVQSEERSGDSSIDGIGEILGGTCSSGSNTIPAPCSPHEVHPKCGLNWRDLYSIAVKWRQASEPCDPVVWVDKLSEKEYAAGFGSHTPMLLGQVKVVRYYPNFPRAFIIAKDLILEQRHVYNAANGPVDLTDPMLLLAVDAAANCRDVYDVVREDFWIVTPCHSTAVQGTVLEGTRFTLQKTGLDGFEFSIRTPCTPPRWADYDKELAAAWEEYCNIYCERCEVGDNGQLIKQLQDCILRLSFYWYNFMPLARGTAVVGYLILLGLFLAADMEITASIPEGMQVDWEAILSPHLDMFKQAVRPWLYPSVEVNTSWQNLPNISETFTTLGSVIAALSSHN